MAHAVRFIVHKLFNFDFLYNELNPRIVLVYQLTGMDFHAIAVVLDGLAALQTIEQYLHAIVKVGTHILMIHIHVQLEESIYIGVPQSALQIERFLVFLQHFLLGKAPMPIQGYYLVCVGFRWQLAVYCLLLIFHNRTR